MGLSACSNDPLDDPDSGNITDNKEIQFFVNEETRSHEAAMGTLDSFYVTSTFAESLDEDLQLNYHPSIYFSDVMYTKRKSDGAFISANGTYYWPGFRPLNFYAHYPSLEELDASIVTDLVIYDIKPKTKISEQFDFVVAKAHGSNTTGEVALSFNHCMSQVEIRAKNGNSAYTFNIKGVVLGNFVSDANYDMKMAGSDTESGWDLTSSRYSYRSTDDFPIILDGRSPSTEIILIGKDGINNTGPAYIIPQTTIAWNKDKANNTGSYIGVLLQIWTNDGRSLVFPNDVNHYAWAIMPIEMEFKRNHKHVITLDFSKGAGVVGPELGVDPNGDNNGLTDAYIDMDIAKEHLGEKILGNEAKVSASITGWDSEVINYPIEM